MVHFVYDLVAVCLLRGLSVRVCRGLQDVANSLRKRPHLYDLRCYAAASYGHHSRLSYLLWDKGRLEGGGSGPLLVLMWARSVAPTVRL